jgi:hypothetical protein
MELMKKLSNYNCVTSISCNTLFKKDNYTIIINHLLLQKNDLKEIFEILKKESYENYSYVVQVI